MSKIAIILTCFFLMTSFHEAHSQTQKTYDDNFYKDLANVTSYECGGTEPFWNLVITPNSITFQNQDNMDHKTNIAWVKPDEARGLMPGILRTYRTKTKDKNETVNIIIKHTGNCSDGMSDINYAYETTLILKDSTWSGCCTGK